MVVTSVTSVTKMKYNNLDMLQGVTSCNKLLQNATFWGFVTGLLQLMLYMLQLKYYKSACNNVTVVTGEIHLVFS